MRILLVGDGLMIGEPLLDILRAMGLTIRLEPLGLPTLEEVRSRFALDDDEADAA